MLESLSLSFPTKFPYVCRAANLCRHLFPVSPFLSVGEQRGFARFSTYDEFSWISPGTNFPGFSHSMDFYRKLMRKSMHFPYDKVYHRWESNGKKHPYYEKGMGTNLPGFSHSMDLLVFFHAMGNWWENPCMSHIMKHTTGWIYNGKNHPYYGKSMSTISQVLPIRWV